MLKAKMGGKLAVLLCLGALSALYLANGLSAGAGPFDEFESPTVKFGKAYKLRLGTRFCRDVETINKPYERCTTITRLIVVKVLTPIHGIERAAYLVERLDGEHQNGFVFREDLID